VGDGTVEVGGRLVIEDDLHINDDDVREMRLTDQR
jgi:hypothetical protein